MSVGRNWRLMRNRQESGSFWWKPMTAVTAENLKESWWQKKEIEKKTYLVHCRVRVCIEVFIISNIIIRQPPCPRRCGFGSSPGFSPRFAIEECTHPSIHILVFIFFLFLFDFCLLGAFWTSFSRLPCASAHVVARPFRLWPVQFYGKRPVKQCERNARA